VPAALATLLAAVNPALVYYSQEARMYQLLAFLALGSTWLLILWLQGRPRRLLLMIAYVLSITAGLYTHYFFPAVLLAQNLIMLIYLRRSREIARPSRLLGWLAMMASGFLLYLPWLPIFLRQTGGRLAERPPLTEFLQESLRWMAFGPTLETARAQWPLLAYLLLMVLGLFLGRRTGRRGLPYLSTILAGLAVPVLFMWLVGSTRPAFFKFLLAAVPALCLAAGPGFWWLWLGEQTDLACLVRRVLVLFVGGLVLFGSVLSLANMYYDPAYARADYRAIAGRIAEEAHPNSAVILNAANQWEVFTYYHREGAPVFPVPAAYPDPAEIDAQLTAIAAEHRRIYTIFWGEAERDPQRLVERWLDEHAFKATDDWIGDVRFVTYAVPAKATGEMATPADLSFGDDISLLGYTLRTDHLRPGEIVELTLFWQAARPLEERYKVFLHLLDEDGRLIAQRDSEPGGGLALTTTWPPDETIADNHGLLLPTGTPPGVYTLSLGLYPLGDPAGRLSITNDESILDAWPLVDINILAPDNLD
jgi:hypothetical protein